MSNNHISISLVNDGYTLNFEGGAVTENMKLLMKSFFDLSVVYAEALSVQKSMDPEEFNYAFGDMISFVKEFQIEVDFISDHAGPS